MTENENGLFNKVIALAKAGKWEELGATIGQSITDAVLSIDAEGIGRTLTGIINKAAEFCVGFLREASGTNWAVGTQIGILIQSSVETADWDAVGETIGSLIGLKLTALPTIVVAALTQLDWTVIAKALGDAILGAIRGIDWQVNSALQPFQDEIYKWAIEVDFGMAGEVLKQALDAMFIGAFSLTKSVIDSLSEDFKNWLGSIWNDWGNVITAGVSVVLAGVAVIVGGIPGAIAIGLLALNMLFSDATTALAEGMEATGNYLNDNFVQPVMQWFDDLAWSVAFASLDAVYWFQDAWSSVSAWFNENVCQPVVDFFKGMVNGVIDAINSFLNFLNNLSFSIPSVNIKVPDWAKKVFGWGSVTIGGGTFDPFNIPSIPRLATGGLVNSGQLFIANE